MAEMGESIPLFMAKGYTTELIMNKMLKLLLAIIAGISATTKNGYIKQIERV